MKLAISSAFKRTLMDRIVSYREQKVGESHGTVTAKPINISLRLQLCVYLALERLAQNLVIRSDVTGKVTLHSFVVVIVNVLMAFVR